MEITFNNRIVDESTNFNFRREYINQTLFLQKSGILETSVKQIFGPIMVLNWFVNIGNHLSKISMDTTQLKGKVINNNLTTIPNINLILKLKPPPEIKLV